MLSKNISDNISKSSWIRAMFEEGEKLRKIYGPEKVYDFSLGNPDYEPPVEVQQSLEKHICSHEVGLHKYMNNAGYPEVREKIAKKKAEETHLPLTQNHIIMTCGAGGGLNVVLKSILNPDDEVIVLAPYFVEYHFYISNHGGKTIVVNTDDEFQPSIEEIGKNITQKCKAIIINNPNNPTGVIYSEERLQQLAALLESKEKQFGSEILVISDEPYSKIVYDNAKVPSLLNIFKHSVIVDSYSKSLALPGERIGYIAVNPQIENAGLFVSGLVFSNRTLGFVNAPSLFQKVIADALYAEVNTDEYKRRRDFLYENLTALGYTCVKPQGAFYLFPKSLIPDDVEFTKRALKYNLLIVPGSGFSRPGHFRLSYSVSSKTIKNSIPAFKALAEEFKN